MGRYQMSIHLSIAMDRQGVDRGFDIIGLIAHVNFTYPWGETPVSYWSIPLYSTGVG